MNEMELAELENFKKQLHICMKNNTCAILDRGLAVCHSRGNRICSMSTCLKMKKEEENE